METTIDIISGLWSVINDLRLYIEKNGLKLPGEIDNRLDVLEYKCRQYE